MHKKRKFNFWHIITALTIWAFAALTVSFVFFLSSVEDHIEEHAETSLRDVTYGITQLLELKIENQWATLAPVARYAKNESNLLESEYLVQIMDQMKTSSGFTEVFVADAAGNSVSSDLFHTNVGDRYYFKKAMQGHSVMSGILTSRVSGESVFVFARPIYEGGKTRGVLGGGIRIKDFQKLIDLSPFDGNGYAYIFGQDGKILLKPQGIYKPIEEENLITYFSKNATGSELDGLELANEIKHRRNDYFTFTTTKGMQSAYYMPLGINDWYVLLGINHDYLIDQSRSLSWTAVWLCIGLTLAFIPIVLAVWGVEKVRRNELLERNRELQLNEERFRIITSLSNNVIFEVDLEKGTTTYPSGLDIWKDSELAREGFSHSLLRVGYIHPEDAEAFTAMHKDIPPFTKRLSGEFRVKGNKGEYIWYRIDEVLLSDDKGKAIRSIGRALNIDNEKRAMELLQVKAQLDSGSGLYNKSYTELSIKRCLEEQFNGKHAMIVMDIDDFKIINDTKGHLFGDRVIEDLGDILKHRFRASDILGRIGGDEFMVFLKDIPDEGFVAEKIEQVHNTIKELHKITISTGIAIYPRDGITYKELYRCADEAMYSVKKDDGKEYVFYIGDTGD